MATAGGSNRSQLGRRGSSPEDGNLRSRLRKRARYLQRTSFTPGQSGVSSQKSSSTPSGLGEDTAVVLPQVPNLEGELPSGLLLSAVVHPRTYAGVLAPDHRSVEIQDPQAAQDLFDHGFYGKGDLSRSRPQFDFPLEPWNSRFHEDDHREKFQLGAVESFWLLHTLGCLRIVCQGHHPDQSERKESPSDEEAQQADAAPQCQETNLSVADCWKLFRAANPRFVELYTVYFFLRSRGWVVRSGLKYGVDFVIYRLGPHQTHAQFSVVVESYIPSGEVKDQSSEQRLPQSWVHLQASLRMTHNVAKSLLTAQVIVKNPQANQESWDTPSCLSSLAVRTFVIRRANVLHAVGAQSTDA